MHFKQKGEEVFNTFTSQLADIQKALDSVSDYWDMRKKLCSENLGDIFCIVPLYVAKMTKEMFGDELKQKINDLKVHGVNTAQFFCKLV